MADEPLRMRLHRALDAIDMGDRWSTGRKAHFTREEFLDIMAELIQHDTEVRARQLDVAKADERRREGAAWALVAMQRAGLLNRKGAAMVRSWKDQEAGGLFPDLSTETVQVVPPGEPLRRQDGTLR